jgi:hypothetical protein
VFRAQNGYNQGSKWFKGGLTFCLRSTWMVATSLVLVVPLLQHVLLRNDWEQQALLEHQRQQAAG